MVFELMVKASQRFQEPFRCVFGPQRGRVVISSPNALAASANQKTSTNRPPQPMRWPVRRKPLGSLQRIGVFYPFSRPADRPTHEQQHPQGDAQTPQNHPEKKTASAREHDSERSKPNTCRSLVWSPHIVSLPFYRPVVRNHGSGHFFLSTVATNGVMPRHRN